MKKVINNFPVFSFCAGKVQAKYHFCSAGKSNVIKKQLHFFVKNTAVKYCITGN